MRKGEHGAGTNGERAVCGGIVAGESPLQACTREGSCSSSGPACPATQSMSPIQTPVRSVHEKLASSQPAEATFTSERCRRR